MSKEIKELNKQAKQIKECQGVGGMSDGGL